MRVRTTVVTLLIFSFLSSSTAMAQQEPSRTPETGKPVAGRHITDFADLRQAIVEQAATDQRNREAVFGVLRQPQVREVASRLGLTVTRAENAVRAIDGAELARIAAQARAVDADLAGGDTLVISVTTLLLIIILVVLLAR